MPFYIIRMKRGTAAEWAAANPVLSEGEWGLEINTGKMKIGDGISPWDAIDYTIDRVFTSLQQDKLSGIEPGAQVNPPVPTGDEIANPTGTETRSWSPADLSSLFDVFQQGGAIPNGVLTIGPGMYLTIGGNNYLTAV